MNIVLKDCKSCWNCKHSVFRRRTATNHVRVAGVCLRGIEETVSVPEGWNPPAEFWNDARDGTFPKEWEEFKKVGALYYGDSFVLDIQTGGHGNYVDMAKIKRDYEIMSIIARNFSQVVDTLALKVCDLHESHTGA